MGMEETHGLFTLMIYVSSNVFKLAPIKWQILCKFFAKKKHFLPRIDLSNFYDQISLNKSQ